MPGKLAFILLMLATPWVAIAQTPRAPATTQAGVQDQEERIAHGSIRVPVPPDWEVLARREDSLGIQLNSTDPPATLIIKATPQKFSLTNDPTMRHQMSQAIVKDLKQKLADERVEVLNWPRVVKDDEFFIRIHDRHRTGGKIADRTHFFRALGVYLIMVTCITYDGTDAQISNVNELAGKLIWQIRTAKVAKPPGVPTTGKPSLFQKAGMKLVPPEGWVEDKTDRAEGVVAVYRRPVGPGKIHVRVVSMVGRSERTEVLVRQLLEDELSAHAIPGAVSLTKPVSVPTNMLGKSRLTLTLKHVDYRVEARVARFGEKLVCVTAVSGAKQAQELESTADGLANRVEKLPR